MKSLEIFQHCLGDKGTKTSTRFSLILIRCCPLNVGLGCLVRKESPPDCREAAGVEQPCCKQVSFSSKCSSSLLSESHHTKDNPLCPGCLNGAVTSLYFDKLIKVSRMAGEFFSNLQTNLKESSLLPLVVREMLVLFGAL